MSCCSATKVNSGAKGWERECSLGCSLSWMPLARANGARTHERTCWDWEDTNLLTVNKADIQGMCHNIAGSTTEITECVFSLDGVFLANECRGKQRMSPYERGK